MGGCHTPPWCLCDILTSGPTFFAGPASCGRDRPDLLSLRVNGCFERFIGQRALFSRDAVPAVLLGRQIAASGVPTTHQEAEYIASAPRQTLSVGGRDRLSTTHSWPGRAYSPHPCKLPIVLGFALRPAMLLSGPLSFKCRPRSCPGRWVAWRGPARRAAIAE